jgi:hypothetical protein
VFDDLEGERACLVATGEVDCLLSERGCRGVMGAELDRRSAFLAAVLTRPSSGAGREAAVGAGFAASPSALRVALTTCVASAAFSLIDRPFSAGAAAGLARRDGALATVFVLDRVGFAALEAGRGLVSSTAGVSSLGSSKLLSNAEVAGVQVATDETALRTASAWASGVSMKKACNGLIPNHIIAVPRTLSKRQQDPGAGGEKESNDGVGVRCWDIELRPVSRGARHGRQAAPTNRG